MRKIVGLILAAVSALSLCACSTPSEQTDPVPVSIAASGARTEFSVGERFSMMGLTVSVQLSDGGSYTAEPSQYRCDSSSFDSSAAGTYPITVTLIGYDISDVYSVFVKDDGVQEEKFVIGDVSAWLDSAPSDFVALYEGQPVRADAIEYRYDEGALRIDAQTCRVTALEEGTFSVEAAYGSEQTVFEVTCYPAADMTSGRYDTSDYDGYLAQLAARWTEEGSTQTTVFLGDSFFDTRYFWTDFYATYAGKDALCFGISSTTTYDWEKILSRDLIFGEAAPKNIVIHLGTNNLYDDLQSAEGTVRDLQRLFHLIRERYPDTGLYYFGISIRSYDPVKIAATREVNAQIMEWCRVRDWIVYLDTPPQLTADKLRDGVHPKLEWYSVFIGALNAAGISISSSGQDAQGA